MGHPIGTVPENGDPDPVIRIIGIPTEAPASLIVRTIEAWVTRHGQPLKSALPGPTKSEVVANRNSPASSKRLVMRRRRPVPYY